MSYEVRVSIESEEYMKRFWKIFGITAAAVVGGVLLLGCIAVGIIVWAVFTPSRMTPVVRQVADQYIVCEHEIGEVELTFFSTFPEFGLRIGGVCLVNPKEGAQNDTLLYAPEVVTTVNVREYLNNNRLVVRELSLPDAVANIYIAADGTTNYDVFAAANDTTATDTTDTTSSGLPFADICIDAATVEGRHISFVDRKDSIDASLENTALGLTAESWDKVRLRLHAESVSATMGTTRYADSLEVELDLPAAIDLERMNFRLHKAVVRADRYTIGLDGEVQVGDSIGLNMDITANEWQIRPLFDLLPQNLTETLKDIEVDGKASLSAHVEGVYGESSMPRVTAHIELEDGEGKYAGLPYLLTGVEMEADADIDMNQKAESTVEIHRLQAQTKDTKLSATGQISDPLGDMLIDLQAKADVSLADMAYFLPDSMELVGRCFGNIGVRIHLDDLTNLRLERGRITGDLKLTDIDYAMSGMTAALPDNRLQFQIPNPKPTKKTVGWLQGTLTLQSLDFGMADGTKATLGQTDMSVEASNILGQNPIWYATLGLQSNDPLTASMDSMAATVKAPKLTAYAEYDTKDTTAVPVLNAQVAFADLQGHYTDMVAHLTKSTLEASLRPSRKDKTTPWLKASIQTASLEAAMGNDLKAKTGALNIAAAARYNKQGENVLLQWNPKLDVSLTDGEVETAQLTQKVYVPQITFSYSNKDFRIEKSQMRVGKSDFALSGEVKNIGAWLRKEGTMVGELDFVSDHTDVNELMALCSADAGSEEQAADGAKTDEMTAAAATTTGADDANPFLVPTGVDVALNTHIKEAVVFNETAHNLKGKLYIKDGVLVLDEMGFVCNAAKLQLTAMYRTPRRNHIYVGFDYHMIDINIEELIRMIPQLDSIVPMLRSFKGAAEFHLAAETYTNAKYEFKPSTLRGACSIYGKDLVVMDGETFSKISKLLLFNKKTENKVDSISAEITVYKKEIDVYPFCVSMDNYMVALGGQHTLDMTYNYDINVLSPIYLGVHVSGNNDDLKIKLAKCKYAKDFKPHFHGKVDEESANMRKMIRNSMRKNVKIKSDEQTHAESDDTNQTANTENNEK